jgi:hypothetical protein
MPPFPNRNPAVSWPYCISVTVKAANVFPSFQRKAIARAGAIGIEAETTVHNPQALDADRTED